MSASTIKRDGKLAEEVAADPELAAALNNRTEFKKARRKKKEAKRERRRKENRDKLVAASRIFLLQLSGSGRRWQLRSQIRHSNFKQFKR